MEKEKINYYHSPVQMGDEVKMAPRPDVDNLVRIVMKLQFMEERGLDGDIYSQLKQGRDYVPSLEDRVYRSTLRYYLDKLYYMMPVHMRFGIRTSAQVEAYKLTSSDLMQEAHGELAGVRLLESFLHEMELGNCTLLSNYDSCEDMLVDLAEARSSVSVPMEFDDAVWFNSKVDKTLGEFLGLALHDYVTVERLRVRLGAKENALKRLIKLIRETEKATQ